MSWTKDDMLEFMKLHKSFFGREVMLKESASDDWICKRFTSKLFQKMISIDFYQIFRSGYVDVVYEGKGDIKSMRLRKGVVLPMEKCVDIANFIAGRTRKLTPLDVFAIMKYIDYGVYLRTDYLGILERAVLDRLEGK